MAIAAWHPFKTRRRSLRFHSLSSRKSAMVARFLVASPGFHSIVACSRALRRPQE
jgi:hypothetical protein